MAVTSIVNGVVNHRVVVFKYLYVSSFPVPSQNDALHRKQQFAAAIKRPGFCTELAPGFIFCPCLLRWNHASNQLYISG